MEEEKWLSFEFSVVNIKSGGFGGEEAVPPGMCKALFGTCLPQLFFIMREQEEDLVTRIPVCYGRAGVKSRQWCVWRERGLGQEDTGNHLNSPGCT